MLKLPLVCHYAALKQSISFSVLVQSSKEKALQTRMSKLRTRGVGVVGSAAGCLQDAGALAEAASAVPVCAVHPCVALRAGLKRR